VPLSRMNTVSMGKAAVRGVGIFEERLLKYSLRGYKVFLGALAPSAEDQQVLRKHCDGKTLP
jgi:hypothetical protein